MSHIMSLIGLICHPHKIFIYGYDHHYLKSHLFWLRSVHESDEYFQKAFNAFYECKGLIGQ